MKRSRLTREGYRYRACAVIFVSVALLAWLGGPLGNRAEADEDQPRPPAMERLFPGLKDGMKDLPAFLRDTDVTLYLRSYFFDRENPDGTENEAWAFGGWLGYRSGWLLDTFQIGATLYGSKQEKAMGRACRQANVTWQVVS